MELTGQIVKAIGKDVEAAIKSVAEKYGVALFYGGGSYSSLEATVRIKIVATGENGETKAARDFKELAVVYGLKPEWLGKTFERNGISARRSASGTTKIVGLLPRRSRFPVLVQNIASGKEFLLTTEEVQRKLGASAPASTKAVGLGSECPQCQKPEYRLVSQRRVGPEVASLRYRCASCGYTDTDVAD